MYVKGVKKVRFVKKQQVFVRFRFIDFLDLFCSCRYELVLLNKTSYVPFAILFSVAIAFCKHTVSADDSKCQLCCQKMEAIVNSLLSKNAHGH